MQIWKYTLQITDTQSLRIPRGAKLLTVQEQGGQPQLWALVNEKAEPTQRNLVTYGTGNPMPDADPGAYLGTYQVQRAQTLVFHVFEPRVGLTEALPPDPHP